jgi:photosystem II stability/assembly factor-like uncharacterized protein
MRRSLAWGAVLVPLLVLVGDATAAPPPPASHWVSYGPDGGPMSTIAVDPLNPLVLYAGAQYGGLYTSTNGGAVWHRLVGDLSGLEIVSMAVGGGMVYAATEEEGLFKSTDGGITWVDANGDLPQGVRTVEGLAVDPVDPTTLYLSAQEPGAYDTYDVYKTTDGGVTWAATGLGLSPEALGVDPSVPSRVFAGSYRSIDAGATWTEMEFDDPCLCGSAKGFAFGPEPGFVFTVLDKNSSYSGYVDKSTDAGVTWDKVLDTKEARSVVATSQVVFAGTGGIHSGVVWKSVDQGVTWTEATDGLPTGEVLGFAADPTDPLHVYVASANGGISETTDGGATWRSRNGGIREELIDALAVSPSLPSVVYAGTQTAETGNGVDRGTRRGQRWGPLVLAGDATRSVDGIAVDPTDPNRLFATVTTAGEGDEGYILRSADGGRTWTDVGPGNLFAGSKVVIDPSDPDTVYVVNGVYVLYKSTDSGGTWHQGGEGIKPYPSSLAVDPSSSNVLYAGAPSFGGIYRSINGGGSFRPWGLTSYSVFDLAVHPLQPSTIYAAAFDAEVWRTDDGGLTWRWLGDGLPDGLNAWAIEVDPTDPDVAYVALDAGGVWSTTDGGLTWAAMNDGLGDLVVRTLAIDSTGDFLYAGTGGSGYSGPGGEGVFQIRLR